MAYRFEKEANGEYALVISRGANEGSAASPYEGLNNLSAVNLNTPDEISTGYTITTSATSGGTLAPPIARSTSFLTYLSQIPSGAPQYFAILDENGRAWQQNSTTGAISGTWTFLSTGESHAGAGILDGCTYFLGYFFKTRGANIDYYDGTTWTNAWQTTLTANVKHFMFVGTSPIMYITNGSWVAQISLTNPSDPTTFNPANALTFSLSVHKVQISTNEQAISLAEIGFTTTSLLIGGTGYWVYPWDKQSGNVSPPIYVADPYQKNIVSVNQNAYIFPGSAGNGRGRIYITNGSQAQLHFKVPDYLFNIQDPYYEWGDAIAHRNNLLFGFFLEANAASNAVQLVSEVWALDLSTKAFRSISNISTATAKGNATALLSAVNLASPGFGYMVGWDDDVSTPGIGYSGTTSGIGTANITTDLMPVGTFTQKRTFSQLEYKIRSPLQSGENIQIFPVVDGTFASALTFNPTPTTGSISGYASVNFQNAQWLQFLITLTGNSATSGVRWEELRLR